MNPIAVKIFCVHYNNFKERVPLVLVPTTYNHLTEDDLKEYGADIIIYANHLLRSSYKSMTRVAKQILSNKRSRECDDDCCAVNELFALFSENASESPETAK
jgi:phosphoenolpyruvate phosphomutase